jgi:hypothetical protein
MFEEALNPDAKPGSPRHLAQLKQLQRLKDYPLWPTKVMDRKFAIQQRISEVWADRLNTDAQANNRDRLTVAELDDAFWDTIYKVAEEFGL